jgi:hypothetical protein
VLDDILADAGSGRPVPDVGLSLVFWPRWEQGGGSLRRLAEVLHVESCDFVFEPAADGRVLEKLAGEGEGAHAKAHSRREPAVIARERSDRGNRSGGSPERDCFAREERSLAMTESRTNCNGAKMDSAAPLDSDSPARSYGTLRLAGEKLALLEPVQLSKSGDRKMNENKKPNDELVDDLWGPGGLTLFLAQERVASSGLPLPSQERMMKEMHAEPERWDSPEKVDGYVQAERAYLARLQEDRVVQMGGPAPPRAARTSPWA